MHTNSYRCETAFEFRLEANSIPTLDKADDLSIEAAREIKDIIADKASDVEVLVAATSYDNQVDGTVEYNVNCDFTLQLPYVALNKESTKNLAFYTGIDVADAFESLGHRVIDFKETKNDVKVFEEKNRKKQCVERG